MNKQKFIELLRKPASVTAEDINKLEEITDQYPYFQSAYILLAKGAKVSGHPEASQKIARAAVYSTDRMLLKKYLSGEMIFLDSVDRPPLDISEELPEKKIPVQNGGSPGKEKPNENSPSATEPENTANEQSFDSGSILDEIAVGLASYKQNKSRFDEYLKDGPEEKTIPEITPLSEESAAGPENHLTSEPVAEPELTNKETEAKDIEPDYPSVADAEKGEEPTDSTEDFDLDKLIREIKEDEEASAREQLQPEKPASEEAEKPDENPETTNAVKKKIIISGSNRDRSRKKETQEAESTENKAEKPENEAEQPVAAAEEQPVAEDPSLSQGAIRKAKMKKLKLQKHIIDEFIDSGAKMPRPVPGQMPDSDEEKSRDLAEGSQKPEVEVISENMAIIYKNQGKIPKAIEIYNKLILKFPEKEAYFAARIKALK